MKYYSQCFQDKFVSKFIFGDKQNGKFLDIGAYDGETFSNTLFFEKNLNWTGLCLEPIPEAFEKLIKIRKCVCVNACASDKNGFVEFSRVTGPSEMLSGINDCYDDKHKDRIKKEVEALGGKIEILKVASVNSAEKLIELGFNSIDYLTIDIEGGEYEALNCFDFSKVNVTAMTVENNYNDEKIRQLLKSKNMYFVGKLVSDDIYINTNFEFNKFKVSNMIKIYSLKYRILRKLGYYK